MSVPRWTITDRERERFATYSGDHNPIHTEPIAARRLMGGRVLVHGAHVVLAVLGQTAARLNAVPDAIDVTFRRGVRPDAALATAFEHDGGRVRAHVSTDGAPAVDITITEGHGSPIAGHLPPTGVEMPAHHTLESLAGIAGEVELTGNEAIAGELFPSAVELLGSQRVAELATLSRVVGMHAPGLHSMSSRYEIRLIEPAPEVEARSEATVRYSVRGVDPRMRRVTVDVDGPAQRARITAFALPEPVDQRDLVDVERVHPSEFTGCRVLVVGGSRGLGAAAVRLLAAAGADVRFTYHVGDAEARAIVADTSAVAIEFDAPNGGIAQRLGEWAPTHVAWFAAPAPDDERALAVQVDAFMTAVDALAAPPLRGVLWPSCDRPRPVQLAGEQRCAELAGSMPDLTVHVPRLPLMATDRTLALLPTDYADTTAVMLAELRALCG